MYYICRKIIKDMITEICVVGCTNDKHHSICDHSRAVLPLWVNTESIDDLYYSKTFDPYELLKIDLSSIIVGHKLINYNPSAQFRYKKKYFINYVVDVLGLPLEQLSKLMLLDKKSIKLIRSKKLISPLDRWIDGDFKAMEKKLFKINDTKVCVSK